jgi:hypothetical protein
MYVKDIRSCGIFNMLLLVKRHSELVETNMQGPRSVIERVRPYGNIGWCQHVL